MNFEEKAAYIAVSAYQMYTGTPSKYVENPFPMYSYDTPAYKFWKGFIVGLLEKGATEEEVGMILRSKHMRWMFDAHEDCIVEFGKGFAEMSYIEWTRELPKYYD